MNPALQTLIIEELDRLEFEGHNGLLGRKYLSDALTTPDAQGSRVTFININPAGGWAIVAWGPPRDDVKYKFLKEVDQGWVYDGIEKMEEVH